MITISLCMIVRDEQDNIAQCLKSVGDVADEVIVVDTGSVDETMNVARQFTQHVLEFPWIDDFAAARNFAFAHATMEYILWLDADDRVDPEEKQKLLELKRELDPSVDCAMLRYNIAFDEQDRPTFSYFRERLVRRAAGFLWREPVHEYLQVAGNVVNLDVAISHRKAPGGESSDRNLRIYERQLRDGRELSPRGVYYYARELMEHGRTAEAVEWFEKFLDGGRGWVEDNIVACRELGRCRLALGDERAALLALLRSFSYDTPRAEACCRLGYLFKTKGDFRQAVFWFELAQSLTKPEGGWGFVQNDDWDYVPCLECSVCYYALGDLNKAEFFNARAGQAKPDSEAVKNNRELFASLRVRADKIPKPTA